MARKGCVHYIVAHGSRARWSLLLGPLHAVCGAQARVQRLQLLEGAVNAACCTARARWATAARVGAGHDIRRHQQRGQCLASAGVPTPPQPHAP